MGLLMPLAQTKGSSGPQKHRSDGEQVPGNVGADVVHKFLLFLQQKLL